MRGSIIFILLLVLSAGAVGKTGEDDYRRQRDADCADSLFRYQQDRRDALRRERDGFNRDRDAKLEGLRAQDEGLAESGRQLEEQSRRIQGLLTKNTEEQRENDTGGQQEIAQYEKTVTDRLEGKSPPEGDAKDPNLPHLTARRLSSAVNTHVNKDVIAGLSKKKADNKWYALAMRHMVRARMFLDYQRPTKDFAERVFYVTPEGMVAPDLLNAVSGKESDKYREKLGESLATRFDIATDKKTEFVGGFYSAIDILAHCYRKTDDTRYKDFIDPTKGIGKEPQCTTKF